MKNFHFNLLILTILITTTSPGQLNSLVTGYINVNGGQLYYETYGQGDETILFIHDGLVHSEVWENQFSTFADKFRVVRYDRRGYGHSPSP